MTPMPIVALVRIDEILAPSRRVSTHLQPCTSPAVIAETGTSTTCPCYSTSPFPSLGVHEAPEFPALARSDSESPPRSLRLGPSTNAYPSR